jgi:hypothetical protein
LTPVLHDHAEPLAADPIKSAIFGKVGGALVAEIDRRIDAW